MFVSVQTFIADVESRVLVGLLHEVLDPHGRALADHPLKGDMCAPTRVEEHHRSGIQAAPQNQSNRKHIIDNFLLLFRGCRSDPPVRGSK